MSSEGSRKRAGREEVDDRAETARNDSRRKRDERRRRQLSQAQEGKEWAEKETE